MKKLLSVILALAMLLSLTAAFAEDAVPAAEEPAAEEPAVAAEAAPVLLATVNGTEIYDNNSDLLDLVSYYAQMYEQYGMDASSEETQRVLKAQGLDWAVQAELYRQHAAAEGVGNFTDEQLAAFDKEARDEWNTVVEELMADNLGITEESAEDAKASARVQILSLLEMYYGYTEDSYAAEIVKDRVFSETVKALEEKHTEGIDVSEDEIIAHFNDIVEDDKESYEGNIFMYEYSTQYMGQSSYYVPEGYRGIIHILLKPDDELMKTYTDLSAAFEEQQEKETADEAADEAEPAEAPVVEEPAAEEPADDEPAGTPAPAEEPKEPVTQEQVDAARAAVFASVQPTVDEIIARFESGTPFADLVAEYGTDPGMKDPARLAEGYAVHKESVIWDPVFTEAAMSIDGIGGISEPVLGSNGVHILFYLRDIPAGAVDMTAEIRDTIRTDMLEEKKNDAMSTLMAQWKAEPGVQYTEAGQALMDAAAAEMAAGDESAEVPAEEAAPEEEQPAGEQPAE